MLPSSKDSKFSVLWKTEKNCMNTCIHTHILTQAHSKLPADRSSLKDQEKEIYMYTYAYIYAQIHTHILTQAHSKLPATRSSLDDREKEIRLGPLQHVCVGESALRHCMYVYMYEYIWIYVCVYVCMNSLERPPTCLRQWECLASLYVCMCMYVLMCLCMNSLERSPTCWTDANMLCQWECP